MVVVHTGNPVENGATKIQGYRTRVILAVPWLRELDFVPIGSQERVDAKVWTSGKRDSIKDGCWRPCSTLIDRGAYVGV